MVLLNITVSKNKGSYSDA